MNFLCSYINIISVFLLFCLKNGKLIWKLKFWYKNSLSSVTNPFYFLKNEKKLNKNEFPFFPLNYTILKGAFKNSLPPLRAPIECSGLRTPYFRGSDPILAVFALFSVFTPFFDLSRASKRHGKSAKNDLKKVRK